MILAYIGLGSNLDQPCEQIAKALVGLADLPMSLLLRQSSLYRSAPWGPVEQPDFINAVAELETSLDPDALLVELLALERRLGRHRDGSRWGPRRIDLDLLLHGDQASVSTQLQIPHPRIAERAFVLMPLAELRPNLELPGKGNITELMNRINCRDCICIENH